MRQLRPSFVLVVVFALALGSQALLAVPQGGHPEGVHQPPHSGKWVRGHWTPYDPPDPDLFPEESRVHIIVPGDTLWDLSQTYLGDPWLWPQLWDQNRYILDSHWIYPGDPLLIPPPPVVVAEPVEPEDTVPPPVEVRPLLGQPVAAADPAPPALVGPELRPVASESDLYCSSYVSAPVAPEGLHVGARWEEAKTMLSEWDVVYLSEGRNQGIEAGTEYLVFRPGKEVKHPATKEVLGQAIQQIGRLSVMVAHADSATARVLSTCTELLIGDRLVPFEEVPVPLTVYPGWEQWDFDLSDAEKGFIVFTANPRPLGQGDLVDLDLGNAQGVEPGDYLLVYTEFRDEHRFFSSRTYLDPATRRSALADKYPEKILGQVVVIRSMENTSTARIIQSAREIVVGDRVAKD
jgi:hypothetical protein